MSGVGCALKLVACKSSGPMARELKEHVERDKTGAPAGTGGRLGNLQCLVLEGRCARSGACVTVSVVDSS